MAEGRSYTLSDSYRLPAQQRFEPLPLVRPAPANSTASAASAPLLWVLPSRQAFPLDTPQAPRGRGLAPHVERALRIAEEELDDDDDPPTEAAREACRAHFRKIDRHAGPDHDLPQPDVSAPGDGEISLEWRIGGRKLFVTVFPDGVIRTFRARIESGRTVEPVVRVDPRPGETLEDIRWLTAVPRAG